MKTPLRTGPATLAAEMLETRGEYQAALDWFDRALQSVDVEAIAEPGGRPSLAAGVLQVPWQGRSRAGHPQRLWSTH